MRFETENFEEAYMLKDTLGEVLGNCLVVGFRFEVEETKDNKTMFIGYLDTIPSKKENKK